MALFARLLLLKFLILSPAYAVDSISLQLDSLETEFLQLADIQLNYGPALQQTARPVISLVVSNIHSPWFEHKFSATLECREAFYDFQQLQCVNGELKIAYPGLEPIIARLDLDLNLFNYQGEFTLLANTTRGSIRADYRAGKDHNWHMALATEDLNITFLSGPMISAFEFFAGHRLTAGKASLEGQLSGSAGQLNEVKMSTELSGLSIEGDSILENVGLKVSTDVSSSQKGWRFQNTINFVAGEMYIQPGVSLLGDKPGFYIASAQHTIPFRLKGEWIEAGAILEIAEFSFLHPGIIELSGSGRFVLGDEFQVPDLQVRAKIEDLAVSYPVYLQPVLLRTNYSDLETTGAIDLSLEYTNSELDKVEVTIGGVYLEDRASRFSVSDLNSHFLLTSDSNAKKSSIGWAGMSFYQLDFGAGDIVFESINKNVRVLKWQDVSILDGALEIDEFDIKNIASRDFALRLGGKLKPISMQALTHALGWIIFPGELSGEISGLKYAQNNLQVEGDISVSVFGGELTVQNLQVEDLFSSYSVLTTDIKFEKLDLEQLTDVFTFGKIEGSLSGKMDKLRLEDWQPSYFEAEFATPVDDDAPHRISQKALENLNELGGGLSGTLSRGFLRFLPYYSYGRLGISCRLVNGVCELGGVADKGDSFSILTKGGLLPPWVEVKGAGRSIKWDDLIGGLKQISEGEVTIE